MSSLLVTFLGPLVDPIGIFWVALLFASAFQLRKRKWSGAIISFFFAMVLFVAGGTTFANRLLRSLEQPYARADFGAITNADAIVMLGGVATVSPYDAAGFDLAGSADRIITAIEFLRTGKAHILVLCGPLEHSQQGPVTEGELLKKWIERWGLTSAIITPLEGSANTREEAEKVAALAKKQAWKKVILVSSAFHLKRATAVFKRLELEVIPVGCDFKAIRAGGDVREPFLDWSRIEMLRLYLHEKVSWNYYRWRGWI